jgi:phage baseplate assembly protein W
MPVDEEQLIVRNTISNSMADVIGKGISFPLRYAPGNTLTMSSAGNRIRESIHLILSTRIGERMFNPEFGSRLPELVFEPNDVLLQNLLNFYTVEALKRWEKRIELTRVSLILNYDNNPHLIGVHIEYNIRNSHINGSYVYPFVREGMPSGDLYTGSEQKNLTNRNNVIS